MMKLQTCNACCHGASLNEPPRTAVSRLARIAVGVAVVAAIVYGELWAIRHEPVIASSSPQPAATRPAAEATAVSFPIAILH